MLNKKFDQTNKQDPLLIYWNYFINYFKNGANITKKLYNFFGNISIDNDSFFNNMIF